MKNILRLLLLGVLGWLALSACAPTDKLAVGDAAKAPGKSDAVEGSIPSPNIVGEEGGLYPRRIYRWSPAPDAHSSSTLRRLVNDLPEKSPHREWA
ncbi:MAG: hypothetical protein R3E39_25530 [Anaerolineae bacterium]